MEVLNVKELREKFLLIIFDFHSNFHNNLALKALEKYEDALKQDFEIKLKEQIAEYTCVGDGFNIDTADINAIEQKLSILKRRAGQNN